MGKTETEISRWLIGTHNFTFATIAKIEVALGINLLEINRQTKVKPLLVNTHTLSQHSWQGAHIMENYFGAA